MTASGVQEVQWKFIHGMFELAIYGGCVDNPFDVSVITSYLEQFFDQAILSPGRKNKHLGPLRLPTSTNFRVCFFWHLLDHKIVVFSDFKAFAD